MPTGNSCINFSLNIVQNFWREGVADIINTLVQIMASMEMWVVLKVFNMPQGASHFFDVPCLLFSLQAGHLFTDR